MMNSVKWLEILNPLVTTSFRRNRNNPANPRFITLFTVLLHRTTPEKGNAHTTLTYASEKKILLTIIASESKNKIIAANTTV